MNGTRVIDSNPTGTTWGNAHIARWELACHPGMMDRAEESLRSRLTQPTEGDHRGRLDQGQRQARGDFNPFSMDSSQFSGFQPSELRGEPACA